MNSAVVQSRSLESTSTVDTYLQSLPCVCVDPTTEDSKQMCFRCRALGFGLRSVPRRMPCSALCRSQVQVCMHCSLDYPVVTYSPDGEVLCQCAYLQYGEIMCRLCIALAHVHGCVTYDCIMRCREAGVDVLCKRCISALLYYCRRRYSVM
jgi:hypothetical protein